MDWAEIVTAVISKSAGAAAGTAVAPIGPVAVAAAGAAAEQATSAVIDTVLREFRAAQHEQTQQLLAANDQVQGRLIGLQASMDTLLNAPLRTALEYVDEAARHPEEREANLELARRRLFDALGLATEHVQRAGVAEQMAVVCALLDRREDTALWLTRAYTPIVEAATATRQSIDEAAAVAERKGRISREPWQADDTRFGVYDRGGGRTTLLAPAAVADSLELLSTLTTKMIFGHTRARMAGATDLDAPVDYIWPVVRRPSRPLDQWYVDSSHPGRDFWVIAPRQGDYAPHLAGWPNGRVSFSLRMASPPSDPALDVRVVGDVPELGEWDPHRGLHLERSELRPHTDPTASFGGQTFLDLEATTAVEYKYVRLLPGEEPRWEVGENRVWDTSSSGELAKQAVLRDSWGETEPTDVS